MIRHIIALIVTAVGFYAMYYMWTLDVKVNKLAEIKRVIEESKIVVKVKKTTIPIEKPKSDKEIAKEQIEAKNKELDEKLAALKKKAGNIAAFKVSKLYKQNCSSCHGVNGKGTIGPDLVPLTKEELLSLLHDFKSGKKKNYVMYGLLQKMDEAKLEELATEIATFKDKWKQQGK